MSRKQTMVPADLAIKVPQELVALAGGLVPSVQALPAYKWVPVSKAAVLRLALSRGLSVMAEEFAGGEPAPTATIAPPAKVQPSPPAEPDDEEPAPACRKPSRMVKPATAARLREWRQGEGLTQTQAAELLGIGQPRYSALETGKRGPTGPQAAKLAALAGIDADDWTATAAED